MISIIYNIIYNNESLNILNDFHVWLRRTKQGHVNFGMFDEEQFATEVYSNKDLKELLVTYKIAWAVVDCKLKYFRHPKWGGYYVTVVPRIPARLFDAEIDKMPREWFLVYKKEEESL